MSFREEQMVLIVNCVVDPCLCGQSQTTNHVVELCPLIIFTDDGFLLMTLWSPAIIIIIKRED